MMKAMLIEVALAIAGCARSTHPVAHDLYYRADSAASSPGITGENVALGETAVRFFGGNGQFLVRDIGRDEFEVVSAPDGYQDTIGRKFKKAPAQLLNWAD